MPVHITSRRNGFFAEIEGVDIARGVDTSALREIEKALDCYAVLLFRGQSLDQAQHIAFGRQLGPLEVSLLAARDGRDLSIAKEISDISNVEPDGTVTAVGDRRRMTALGNRLWHTDSSFMKVPAKYSLLYGRNVPKRGGNTEFADMRAAYDALSKTMKGRLTNLVVDHSIVHSRAVIGFAYNEKELAARPPAEQRLVRFLPGSGRMTLYLASHASSIRGMPVPEGRMLLMELTEHAVQRRFVHSHRWQPGDLVVWDNRATMHRSTASDPNEIRDLHRVTVTDYASSLDQPLE